MFSLMLQGELQSHWSKIKMFRPGLQIHSVDPKIDHDDWISVVEAASYLHMSKGTIYNKVSGKVLPSYKIGGRILLRKSELDRIILKSRRG